MENYVAAIQTQKLFHTTSVLKKVIGGKMPDKLYFTFVTLLLVDFSTLLIFCSSL